MCRFLQRHGGTRRHGLVWTVIASLLLPLCPLSAARADGSCVLKGSINTTSRPKGDGRKVHLPDGATLELMGYQGDWVIVRSGGHQAAMRASTYKKNCHVPAPVEDLPLEPLPVTVPPPTAPNAAPPPASSQPAFPPPASGAPLPQPTPTPPLPSRGQHHPRVEESEEQKAGDGVSQELDRPSALQITLLASGGALILTSAILFAINANRASELTTDVERYNSSDPRPQSVRDGLEERQSQVRTWDVVTIVVGVLGGASAIAGGAMWYRDASRDPATEALLPRIQSLQLALHRDGLSVVGRF